MAWLANYTYRKEFTLKGSTGGAQTDYVREVTVYRSSGVDAPNVGYIDQKCETDFRDIRFTESDGSTLLSYWKEEHIHGSWARFFIKFDAIPIFPNTTTFFMYYENPAAVDASDDAATFLVGADFDDGTTTGLTLNTAGGGALTVPAIPQIHGEMHVDDFMKFPSNPVLAKRPAKWDSESVRDLCPVLAQADNTIVKEAGKIVAFYHGTSGGQEQVGRATSDDDGLTWADRLDNPVIPFGGGGTWWQTECSPGGCIKRTSDGLYLLAMHGMDAGGNRLIGVQTSDDLGLTWDDVGLKLAYIDFTHPDGAMTAMGVPWVIYDPDGPYYIITFEAKDAGGRWLIFGATSTDFTGAWTAMNGGNPIFINGTGGQWDDYAVANPKIVKLDTDKYVLAYNGHNGDPLWNVGFAYATTDLSDWTRHASNPVIVQEGTGWEDESLECSAFVKDNSTYLRFWYQAFGTAPGFQIGLAKCRQGRRLHGVSAVVADGWIAGSMQANPFWASILTKEATDPTIDCALTQLVLVDFAAVPSPMSNINWNPEVRFVITRYTMASGQTHKFRIQYMDVGDSMSHNWDGAAWQAGAEYLIGPGLYEIRMWDDDTNFYLDIIDWWTGVSALAAVATIAKASVKAFSSGRALVSAEQFTTHYYGGQYFDNAIVRKYVEPEPTWDSWGPEQRESVGLSAAMANKMIAAKLI